MSLKPFVGELDTGSNNLKPFTGQLDEGVSSPTADAHPASSGISRSWGEVGSDTLKAGEQGVSQLLAGGSWALGKTGLDTHKFTTAMLENSDVLEGEKSKKAKAANQAVSDAKGFTGTVEALWDNPVAILDQAAQSAPVMIPGMGLGAGAAKVLASRAATRALAAGASREAVALAAKTAATTGAVVGGRVGESAASAGTGGAQAEEGVLNTSIETLRDQSSRFRDLAAKVGDDAARAQLAHEVGLTSAVLQGSATLAGGYVAGKLNKVAKFGDSYSAALVEKVTAQKVARNVAGEVVEEVVQSPLEQVGQNLAGKNADNRIEVGDDVLKSGVLGAAGAIGQSGAANTFGAAREGLSKQAAQETGDPIQPVMPSVPATAPAASGIGSRVPAEESLTTAAADLSAKAQASAAMAEEAAAAGNHELAAQLSAESAAAADGAANAHQIIQKEHRGLTGIVNRNIAPAAQDIPAVDSIAPQEAAQNQNGLSLSHEETSTGHLDAGNRALLGLDQLRDAGDEVAAPVATPAPDTLVLDAPTDATLTNEGTISQAFDQTQPIADIKSANRQHLLKRSGYIRGAIQATKDDGLKASLKSELKAINAEVNGRPAALSVVPKVDATVAAKNTQDSSAPPVAMPGLKAGDKVLGMTVKKAGTKSIIFTTAEGKESRFDIGTSRYEKLAADIVGIDIEQERANQKEALSNVRSQSMKARNAANAAVKPDRDDIHAAIAKLGGLSREDAKAQGIDQAEFSRKAAGLKYVFPKNGGVSFDAMAERLHEHGYPVTDEHGRYSANKLLEVLSDALGGKKVYTHSGHIAAQGREYNRLAMESGDEAAIVAPDSPDTSNVERVENGGEFLPQTRSLAGLYGELMGMGWPATDIDVAIENITVAADMHDALVGMLNKEVPHGTQGRSETSEALRSTDGEGEIPGFGSEEVSPADYGDLTDQEIERHALDGISQEQIRAERPSSAPEFSLESQSEDDLKAKDARENDAKAAREDERKRLAENARDNFQLGASEGFAGVPPDTIRAQNTLNQNTLNQEEATHTAVATKDADDLGGPADEKPMARANRVLSLAKQSRREGVVKTAKEWVKADIEAGARPEFYEEDKIKPLSRMANSRANNEQQAAHEKKVREGGKAKVFTLNEWVIGKAAYDYAVHLYAQKAAASTPEASNNQSRIAPTEIARVESAEEHEVVKIKDKYGRNHRVLKIDLAGTSDRIRTVRQDGVVFDGESIPRSLLNQEEQQSAETGIAPTSNTLFTDEAAAAALARLRSRFGGGTVGTLSPQDMIDGVTLSGHFIEKGARTFSAYAKEMISALGDAARPHLKGWYMGVKYGQHGAALEGMSTAAEVEAASTEDRTDNDRRHDNSPVAAEHRQGPRRVEEMTPEEMRQALLVNPLTDMPNARAFDQDADLGWEHVGAMDIDGFGFLNDIWSHDPVDAILKQIGHEMLGFATGTVRLYHRSGDEFMARGKDKAELQSVLKAVQEKLKARKFEADLTLDGGEKVTAVKQGIGVTYGIGTNYKSADHESNRSKEQRLAAGDRSAKGSNPGGMAEVAAEGRETGLGAAGLSKAETLKLSKGNNSAAESVRTDDFHSEPSAAQKEAGNYPKEKVKWNGLDISIETQAGTRRRGTDEDGTPWEVRLNYDYGYFRGTEGADGDHVDAYIGPHLTSEKVFVVNQTNSNGGFDEHKVMIGFDSLDAAREGYLSSYTEGWDNFDDVVELTVDQFKDWLKNQNTKKPIQDFGERLEGARKFLPPFLKEAVSDDDIARLPFSKVWPADAHESIEDPYHAALVYSAREEIPAKPRAGYKVARWVEKVRGFRQLVRDFEAATPERLEAKSREMGLGALLEGFLPKVRLLSQLPRDTWSRVNEVREWPNAYDFKDGKRISSPSSFVEVDGQRHLFSGDGRIGDTELARIKELLGGKKAATSPETKKQFEIRVPQAGGYAFINRKGDGEYRHLKIFTGTDAVKQARAFLESHADDLVAEWEKVKSRDNVKEADTRNTENRERKAKDWRDGKDATESAFSEKFGFRGVQFGLWVGQGKGGKERQGLLNEAYDALMDLADLLGIPSQAISLNGSLGLAFGARGSGKNAAHFEPSNLVINLTKTKGAGSLAHEWFHALDNYFARARGGEVVARDADTYRQNNYITYKPEPMLQSTKGFGEKTAAEVARMRELHPTSGAYKAENWIPSPNHKEGVRPEVEAAFAKLVEALNDSPMAQRAKLLDKKSDGYWSRIIERGARSFENYVISKMAQRGQANDFLANIKDWKQWSEAGKSNERYPYLFPAEEAPISDAFEEIFQTLKVREEDGKAMLYSRGKSDSWYYSPLSRAVEGLKQETAPASQWTATIKNMPGVKTDELEATGLTDWLAMQSGKVTKPQILEYLSGNGVQVKEVLKGNGGGTAETKYSDYVVHGGENYRELLLTLPESRELPDGYSVQVNPSSATNAKKYVVLTDTRDRVGSGDTEAEALDRYFAHHPAKDGTKAYKSSHWDEKNILAHVRFDERTDAEGKKVLFIHELQSDWGQEGKKKGFATKDPKNPTDDEVRKYFDLRDGVDPADYRDEMVQALATSRERLIPSSPFVTKTDAWVSLAIKRMIRYAAENGFDRVAFINGEQSADLYDLSKQIDNIIYTEHGDGRYNIRATKDDRDVLSDFNVDIDRVEALVGKDLAKKIMAGEGVAEDKRSRFTDSPYTEKTLSGLDLMVGGEGMRTFYDKIVPKVAADVIKKLGGEKVRFIPFDMKGNTTYKVQQDSQGKWIAYNPADQYDFREFDSEEGARTFADGITKSSQAGFDITPAMRDSALAGMPLFAKGAASSGQEKTVIEQLITPIIAKWKNGPRVVVVQSASELPGGAAPHDVEGAYSSAGTVYLVADNLPAEQRVMEVLAHEAIGHAAMEEMLGKELMADLVREINSWERSGSKFFVDLGKEVDKSQPDLPADRRAKEIVALMAERGLHKQGAFWKRVTGAIRAFLRNQGFSGKWLASLTDADMFKMLADAERYLESDGAKSTGKRNAQAALAYSRRGSYGSDRTTWNADTEKAIFATPLNSASNHVDYAAAKAGDWEAAGRLVRDIVPVSKIGSIRSALNGRKPIIVPVVAQESTGANKIPRAYAECLADKLGLQTSTDVVQSVKAFRTNSKSDHRLATQPVFDGPIQKGRDYMIVDDTMTMGGTLANLRGHIEANGGHVILVSALTGYQGTEGLLAITKPMRDAIWAKHGKPLDDYLHSEFGHGIDQLTQGEAGHYRKAGSVDAIRDRISEARRQAGLGKPEEILPSAEVTPNQDQLPPGNDDLLFSKQPDTVGDSYKLAPVRKWVTRLFDRFDRFDQVQKSVSEQGGTVDILSDVYGQEEVFHSRTASSIDRFRRHRMGSLFKRMVKAGVTPEDVGLYAYAQHAPERNAHIATINDGMPDGGSGMTNAEARKILDEFKQKGLSTKLDTFARELRDITADSRNILRNSGLEAPESIDAWENAFKYYVPLSGKDEANNANTVIVGKGFDVRGGQKRAMGRKDKAKHIIEQVIIQHEQAIIRAEKNLVGKRLLQFVKNNPDARLWEINPAEQRRYVSADGQVEYRNQPQRTDRNVVSVRINGNDTFVLLADEKMAEAFHNVGTEDVGHVLRILATVGRFTTRMFTSFSPPFVLVNGVRDLGTAMIHSYQVGGVKYSAGIIKALPSAFYELVLDARTGNSNAVKLYEQSGGRTGMVYMIKDFTEKHEEVMRQMAILKGVSLDEILNAFKDGGFKDGAFAVGRKIRYNKLTNVFRALGDMIEVVNGVVENTTRLAAFNAALAEGKTAREAGSISKNLTVNFNRKGEWAPTLGAMYFFFNASVQGTARLAEALRHPPVQAVAGVMTLASFMLAGMQMDDDDDKDGRPDFEQIPAWQRSRNMIVMNGDGSYEKIPLPLGWNVFHAIGTELAIMAKSKSQNAYASGLTNITVGAVDMFNPVGGFVPSVLAPFLQVAGNKRGLGDGPIYPAYKDKLPDSQQYFDSTEGSVYQQATTALNNHSWGNDFRPGFIDLNPEKVKYITQFFGGGALRFITDTVEGVSAAADGGPAQEADKLPITRAFYGKLREEFQTSRYYENKDKVEKTKAEIDGLRKEKQFDEAAKVRADNPGVMSLANQLNSTGAQMKRIKGQENRVRNDESLSTAERRQKLQALKEERGQKAMHFNQQYERKTQKATSPWEDGISALQGG